MHHVDLSRPAHPDCPTEAPNAAVRQHRKTRRRQSEINP
ncbi:hypothetical protein NY08_3499 [Rhodococcus sp. B7740]|nr:hypothetical protein NY08_3499 [Rhodococcus sp. B7740]